MAILVYLVLRKVPNFCPMYLPRCAAASRYVRAVARRYRRFKRKGGSLLGYIIITEPNQR